MPRYDTNFRSDVRCLNIPNIKTQTLAGHSASIGTSQALIWHDGTYPFPTSAQTCTVSSTNANDTAAGTGARIAYIEYLDANYAEGTATVSLNGQTAVTISTPILRVNSFRIISSGSGKTNAGAVYVGYGTVTAGVPASILSVMGPGDAFAQSAFFTVPANKELGVDALTISTSSAKVVAVQFMLQLYGTNTLMNVQEYYLYANSFRVGPDSITRTIPAKSDIYFTSNTSTGTAEVSIAATLVLYNSNEVNNQAT